MRASFPLFTSVSILLSTAYAFPRPESNTAAVTPRNVLFKRTEPNTGDDLPDTDQHPNQLDRVETGFQDAAEMASYVLGYIDSDTNIFPHYFNEADRANVKQVYNTIYGPNTAPDDEHPGNDLLGNVLVQTTDSSNLCGNGRTLAYFAGQDTENPFIVLCPNAFKKKAVTALNGAGPDDNLTCDDLLADGAHVSYKMNSLGATLFHEYTHYDAMLESIFSAPIIDQDDGYGPVNVYDNLDKNLARLNADSYTYYALHVLWTILCQPPNGFAAPRPGTDDVDPDCAESCHN